MMFGIRMHFVEVGSCFGDVWKAGIGNAGPVLADLQRFWKRLLIPEVQMEMLVWGFASSLLEMVLFLMAFREPLIKGFPVFD